ncbi:PDZ domain-containing protein [Lyngbya confervoides]|uniref:PDZ domain-containing protein n=1 Tax=Lyngbya confervoides BDU141951 TaxID=1574623 RepID=A0ABD4T265_9CYAN|nr:PDZ domain-containing protein [Lyngbya confervoides]MCM1982530.1 PDZ domain-containing protein [Lyngbya confervoides BDU141951]
MADTRTLGRWIIGVALVGSLLGCQSQSTSGPSPFKLKVSAQIHGNLVYVPTAINGGPPRPLILDSGAQPSLLTQEVTRQVGATSAGPIIIHGIGAAPVQAKRLNPLLFDLTGVPLQPSQVLAIPDSVSQSLSQQTGRPFQGILGSVLFQSYVVEVDFQRQTLQLQSPSTFRYSGSGQVLPLKIKQQRPYLEATVRWNDQDQTPGEFLLDLGSTQALDLQSGLSLAEAQRFQGDPERWMIGLGGQERSRVGRVQALELGPITVPNPITAVSHPALLKAGQSKSPRSGVPLAGRIGNQILSRFKVIFNYHDRVVILEPNAQVQAPFFADMSGLQILAEGSQLNEYRVATVYPHTPAHRQGFAPGDRLLTIDQTSVSTLSLHQVRQRFISSPGTVRQLQVERRGAILTKSLILEDLLR